LQLRSQFRTQHQLLSNFRLIASSVTIFLACVITMYDGASLVTLNMSADRMQDALTRAGGPHSISAYDKAFLANWKNESGVANWVRTLLLADVRVETPDDRSAIEAAITQILEISPTDTEWPDLAQIRLARGAPMASVLAALRMSYMTASHSGRAMFQRAAFGLEHWTELPKSDQHTVTRDVALSMIGDYYHPDLRYREIVAAKSKNERDNIRAALIASGLAPTDILKVVGE
jgi:hypothetical protein